MKVSETMHYAFKTIQQDASVQDAAKLMSEQDIGMLPVECEDRITGVLTDRDIVTRAVAVGSDPKTTPVSDVMSAESIYCLEDDDIEDAAVIMEDNKIRRLMVQNSEGRFVGMLTLADLALHQGAEQIETEILHEVSQPAAQSASH